MEINLFRSANKSDILYMKVRLFKMTKTEMRDFAKDKLMEAIAVAYYKLEDENFTQEEVEQITQYINQYGEAMGKAIIFPSLSFLKITFILSIK